MSEEKDFPPVTESNEERKLRKRREKPLSPKQLKFAAGMIAHGKQMRAALEAGYAESSASAKASRLMQNPALRALIDKAMEKVVTEAGYTREAALKEADMLMHASIERKQMSAAVKASEHKANLMGLVKHKLELDVSHKFDLTSVLNAAEQRAITEREKCERPRVFLDELPPTIRDQVERHLRGEQMPSVIDAEVVSSEATDDAKGEYGDELINFD